MRLRNAKSNKSSKSNRHLTKWIKRVNEGNIKQKEEEEKKWNCADLRNSDVQSAKSIETIEKSHGFQSWSAKKVDRFKFYKNSNLKPMISPSNVCIGYSEYDSYRISILNVCHCLFKKETPIANKEVDIPLPKFGTNFHLIDVEYAVNKIWE